MEQHRRALHAAAIVASRAGTDRAPCCGAHPSRVADPSLRQQLTEGVGTWPRTPPSDEEREAFRASYACGCGPERFDLVPLRRTRGDEDAVERVLRDCVIATGERPDGCPWAAMNTPFVGEVVRARKWHEVGELELRYPDGVPNVVMWGIDVYDGAFNSVQVHDMREREIAREEEQRQRDQENAR